MRLAVPLIAAALAAACASSPPATDGTDVGDGKADGHGDAGADGEPSTTEGGPDGATPLDGGAGDVEPDGPVTDADEAEALPPPTIVAVYDDTSEADGSAWAEGLALIEEALDAAGIDHVRVTRARLNGEVDPLLEVDGIVFGGGYAYPGYTVRITPTGKGRIRALVERGGLYVGICAGAYFACESIVYEGSAWDDESGYDLELFPGVCTGPLESVSSYPDFAVAQLALADHASVEGLGVTGPLDIWYAGGPWFEDGLPGVEVLARYSGEGLPEAGFPAVVAASRGDGTVVLFGPHPEVSTPPVLSAAPELLGSIASWALDGR